MQCVKASLINKNSMTNVLRKDLKVGYLADRKIDSTLGIQSDGRDLPGYRREWSHESKGQVTSRVALLRIE